MADEPIKRKARSAHAKPKAQRAAVSDQTLDRGALVLCCALSMTAVALCLSQALMTQSPESALAGVSPAAEEVAVSETIEQEELQSVGVEEAAPVHYDPSPLDFASIEDPDGTSIFPFAFSGDMPQLSQRDSEAITAALKPYTDSDVNAGFLLMNLETGRGFARNIDADIYGASSFKGPMCAYVCKRVDAGDYSLSSNVRSGHLSSDGSSFSTDGSDALSNLISETILYSSNDAFGSLRVTFDRSQIAGWLESIDVDGDLAYDSWFPTYTVRDAARMWVYSYQVMESGGKAGTFLSDALSSTETSFVRDGIERNRDDSGRYMEAVALSGDGEELVALEISADADMLVRSKAGWNADNDPDDCSISENGIITCDGRDYLLCVMTGACYSESNAEHVGDLAAAILDARSALT